MNNGHRVGARTFNDILNGRFRGDKQLAFEQYLGDFRVHGTTYRTYRYAIVNGNMFLLHGVFNPMPAGPALAAPVTQPGSQYANAQTQGSVYQRPYASQLNQPVANSLGPVDPSTVQNMRYPTASTAQRSASQPRQLNAHASEFRLSSAVGNVGASSRPSTVPTANSAPVRPPGLPVTQQPQFAPSNAHRGPSPPEIFWRPSSDNGEAARAEARPPMWTAPYTSLIHSHNQAVHQQPQVTPFNARRGCLKLNTRLGLSDDDDGEAGAPANPLALANNFFTASRDSWMASPSPLDLAAASSSETDNPYFSPRQGGRRSSEHSSDPPSRSSSGNVEAPSMRSSPWPSYHTVNSSVSQVNAANNTSHGSQNGADIGVAPFPPPPPPLPPQFKPHYDTDTTEEHRLRHNPQPSIAIWGESPAWNPIREYSSRKHDTYFLNWYQKWRKSAAPDSDHHDFCIHLKSLPDHIRRYNDRVSLTNLHTPATTSSRGSSDLPSGTVSHHTEPPRVGDKLKTSHEVAEVDTSAAPAPTSGGPNVLPGNGLYLPTSPSPQLHYGEDEDEDWRLEQRLNEYSFDLSNIEEEILTTIEKYRDSLGLGKFIPTRSQGTAARP